MTRKINNTENEYWDWVISMTKNEHLVLTLLKLVNGKNLGIFGEVG
jgi:hypothetical protein